MAGSKRTKIKNALLPNSPPPPQISNEDDEDLMEDLLAHLDSRDQAVQGQSATILKDMQLDQQADQIEATTSKQDSKARHKARMARKAAALAESRSPDNPDEDARLAREAKEEVETISKVCRELDVKIHDINPDGHCLYSAVADQLALLSIVPPPQATYQATRLAASNYIFSHPDDFLHFLPSSTGQAIMSPNEFEQYCASIRDTAVWGGEPEIQALSRAFNVPIHVVQSASPNIVVHNPFGVSEDNSVGDTKVARISYHRRLYGLGEHYNSLRPRGLGASLSSAMQSLLPSS